MKLNKPLWVLTIACVLLTACAAPNSHHIGKPDAGLFLDVPYSWSEINESLIKKAQSGWQVDQAGNALYNAMTWQNVWVADSTVTVGDVFSNRALEQPYVYAMARQLYDGEKSAISSDLLTALQDVVMPASSAKTGDGLTVMSNSTVALQQHDGVSQAFRWKTDGIEQELKNLIVLSKNRTTLYVVIARCSTTCMNTHRTVIDDIFQSVTIKEPNGV